MTRDEEFFKLLHEKAIEIAPDYPNIKSDLGPFELLWAITSSCEGCRLANEDLHDFIEFLRLRLGWTLQDTIKNFKEFQEDLKRKEPVNEQAAKT